MSTKARQELRKIPSLDKLLSSKELKKLQKSFPRKFIKECCSQLLRETREEIKGGRLGRFEKKRFLCELEKNLVQKSKNIGRVINASGIILNTNLGRSPISEGIFRSIEPIVTRYSNLEYDLERGKRGKRNVHLVGLLRELTGTEDAFVVNNNAGAVLLCLHAFAKRKEVIVSRGQLVEIGGSYRLPNILKASGAKLIEVGTTNRTYIEDFENAITKRTGLLLLSHRSNFRMVGFTKDPSLEQVASLGKRYGIKTMMDLGSGLLVNMEGAGLKHEPLVQEVVKSGIDIVSFSGDKLLGGPQAGIILGTRDLISALRKNPLSRALRIDKFTISILENVLRIYLYSDDPVSEIPGLSMAFLKEPFLKRRAQKLMDSLLSVCQGKVAVSLGKGFSEMGGGTLPAEVMDTVLVEVTVHEMKPSQLQKALRECNPPIIARIDNDRVVLDPRTIFEDEVEIVSESFKTICSRI
jgi:L-seryl-tRNA(Ser) seleniumtransferase